MDAGIIHPECLYFAMYVQPTFRYVRRKYSVHKKPIVVADFRLTFTALLESDFLPIPVL